MRKNRSLLKFTIAIAFVALTAIAAADPYVCGDADDSGDVDIDDVVYIINYIFSGGPEPVPYESGDADASGGVDIDDVVYLIEYIFAGGPEPMCSCGTVTDFDGNVYLTILIGDQCWMKENLKVTHYRNGDSIAHVTDSSTWSGLSTGAYCNYYNDEGHVAVYGRLYNWFAVDDSRNIAPEGWHVSTDDEWKQLEMYLGMSQAEADFPYWRGTDEGGKLKEAGTIHWSPPNAGATNETGFSALPGGFRYYYADFYYMGYVAYFWSSTEYVMYHAWSRALLHDNSQVYRNYDYERDGFSVRCVRD